MSKCASECEESDVLFGRDDRSAIVTPGKSLARLILLNHIKGTHHIVCREYVTCCGACRNLMFPSLFDVNIGLVETGDLRAYSSWLEPVKSANKKQGTGKEKHTKLLRIT
jgi:hypothetical protein